MKYKLQEVAVISSGHTIRGRVDNDPQGDCVLFQMRDLNWDEMTLGDTGHKISLEHLPQNQILQPGDVLLLAKGSTNGAFVYRKEYIAAATSVFLVLRVNQERVLPEFLAWYLNQDSTRRELQAAKGVAVIQNLTKNIIENLEIKLPSLETQRKLVALSMLWREEKRQTFKLIEMKDKYFNHLTQMEMINDSPTNPQLPDAYSSWFGLYAISIYYLMELEFTEPIFLKGHQSPTKKAKGIITAIVATTKTTADTYGNSKPYNAVKEWKFVELANMERFRDTNISPQVRADHFENIITHSLISNVSVFDFDGNKQGYKFPIANI